MKQQSRRRQSQRVQKGKNRTQGKAGRNGSSRAVPLVSELDRRLLAMGGREVTRCCHEALAAEMLVRGEAFDLPVTRRPGEPNQCHQNAAGIWAEDVSRYTLVTGYALADGRWVQHSWVVDESNLYETTYPFERYYGLPFAPQEALAFWWNNYLPFRYPGPIAMFNAESERRAALHGQGEHVAARTERKSKAAGSRRS